jgi:hypothetical protein
LIFSLLSCFAKEIYFHGNVGTDKNGGLPLHNPIGFFCWGRSLKIHIKIKSELFMYEINLVVSSFKECWVGKNHHFQLVNDPDPSWN